MTHYVMNEFIFMLKLFIIFSRTICGQKITDILNFSKSIYFFINNYCVPSDIIHSYQYFFQSSKQSFGSPTVPVSIFLLSPPSQQNPFHQDDWDLVSMSQPYIYDSSPVMTFLSKSGSSLNVFDVHAIFAKTKLTIQNGCYYQHM